MKTYQYNDGGKVAAGFRGNSDCAIRAAAIACELSYKDARKLLQQAAKTGKQGNGQISRGVYREDMDTALASMGWRWHAAPKLNGRKARYSDLPRGRIIARMAGHFAAVIDGVVHDTWDSREKMVYGYWKRQQGQQQ